MPNNVKFDIQDGGDFFAHETSVQYSPTQFILDFKSITPRVDPRANDGMVYSLKHNVVLVDPYHATQLLELMTRVIKRYEKEFGKITKPKSVQIMEKKSQKQTKPVVEETKSPQYLG